MTLILYFFLSFVNMLKVFPHALRKFNFFHACIQPYGFFQRGLYVSLEVDIVFFLYLRDLEMFVHILFYFKANRVKSSTNPSFIPQNLTHYQSKLFQNFLNENSILGSMGCKGLKWLSM
jgi:hypothetical protein